MSLHQDWEGLAQERTRAWDAEVRRRHLQQQILRTRATWRQRVGRSLMRLGAWLSQGEEPHIEIPDHRAEMRRRFSPSGAEVQGP